MDGLCEYLSYSCYHSLICVEILGWSSITISNYCNSMDNALLLALAEGGGSEIIP